MKPWLYLSAVATLFLAACHTPAPATGTPNQSTPTTKSELNLTGTWKITSLQVLKGAESVPAAELKVYIDKALEVNTITLLADSTYTTTDVEMNDQGKWALTTNPLVLTLTSAQGGKQTTFKIEEYTNTKLTGLSIADGVTTKVEMTKK